MGKTDRPGFEPQGSRSTTGVLPLHHLSITRGVFTFRHIVFSLTYESEQAWGSQGWGSAERWLEGSGGGRGDTAKGLQ